MRALQTCKPISTALGLKPVVWNGQLLFKKTSTLAHYIKTKDSQKKYSSMEEFTGTKETNWLLRVQSSNSKKSFQSTSFLPISFQQASLGTKGRESQFQSVLKELKESPISFSRWQSKWRMERERHCGSFHMEPSSTYCSQPLWGSRTPPIWNYAITTSEFLASC